MASPPATTETKVTEKPSAPISVITEKTVKTAIVPTAIPTPPPTTTTVPKLPSIVTTPVASAVPYSLRSPAFPSELPRSPMSATFSLLPLTPGVEGALKTPITPPVAYMDFLKNAIASPSDLKSPKFLPHHNPAGHTSAGPSSPLHAQPNSAKRIRASLSGPSGGMPSPGLLGAHMAALAKVNSASDQAKRSPYTPTQSSALSSARSSTSSLSSSLSSCSSSSSGTDSDPVSRSSSGTSVEREPEVVAESSKKVVRFAKSEGKDSDAEEMEVEEDEEPVTEEVCTRKRHINKDGTVTIKQVVTTTVTFKPRMSLMPAPKGKRRRIE